MIVYYIHYIPLKNTFKYLVWLNSQGRMLHNYFVISTPSKLNGMFEICLHLLVATCLLGYNQTDMLSNHIFLSFLF